MRSRLVVALVFLTILVVTLYGVPRAFIRADQIEDREQEQVDQSALLLAALVDSEQSAGGAITDDLLSAVLRPGERVEYLAPDGTAVSAGDPASREVGVEATVPVSGGGSLTLDYSRADIDERVRDALLPLLLIGLLLVALAWLAAGVLARRLAAPFQELEGHARALGSGRFDLDIPHYDVPEAEEIGQALRTSAESLDQLVRRERDFAVNASHELRTPLTAARLRLEDLSLWDITPPEISEELTEVLAEMSRLDDAVAGLLERDRLDRTATARQVDLTRLLVAAAERWRPTLSRQARELSVDVDPDLSVRLPERAVLDIVDALLSTAVEHGEGRVTLSAQDATDYLAIRVGDESRRTQGSEMLRGGNTDSSALPAAATLAAGVGGHLSVGNGTETAFILRLPRSVPT